MSRGHPDWNINVETISPGNTNNIEVSARLGGVNNILRQGSVAWFDDFESTVVKWRERLGNAATIARSTNFAFAGSGCLLLTCGNVDPFTVEAAINIPIIRDGRIGITSRIHSIDTNMEYGVALSVRHGLIGGERYELRYKESGNDLVIKTQSEGEVEISPTPSLIDVGTDTVFNTFKLVVDTDSVLYVSGRINQNVYNLATYDPMEFSAETNPRVIFSVFAEGGNAAEQVAVDNYVITYDEP
jgi:hypothetical protein